MVNILARSFHGEEDLDLDLELALVLLYKILMPCAAAVPILRAAPA